MVNPSTKKNTHNIDFNLSLASEPHLTVARHYPRICKYKLGLSLRTIVVSLLNDSQAIEHS